ncbi:hypothetical protein J4050_10380 [Winogradskyella sp. DF17]|uniref:Uncharacterized protein n=1 Tax=Winogradskyella pelagia TaxID=2819984 RepID=A0ABS3T339_9FLAO|nr:hypothetical protein [Winogradskyella sp. DF17]MBO3117155.1 hypothetical protein [Winogradskyella sp. DF17]
MRLKLHISVLILLLALVAAYVNSTNLPNQQIVIQLTNGENPLSETEELAIERIKSTLFSNGAEQISINRLENGHLKITYFSTSEIYEIEKALSNEVGFGFQVGGGLPDSEVPNNHFESDYLLQVSELQPDHNSNWDFESTEITTSHFKTDRFTKVKHKFSGNFFYSKNTFWHTYKTCETALTIENYKQSPNFNIPEVRAGPFT